MRSLNAASVASVTRQLNSLEVDVLQAYGRKLLQAPRVMGAWLIATCETSKVLLHRRLRRSISRSLGDWILTWRRICDSLDNWQVSSAFLLEIWPCKVLIDQARGLSLLQLAPWRLLPKQHFDLPAWRGKRHMEMADGYIPCRLKEQEHLWRCCQCCPSLTKQTLVLPLRQLRSPANVQHWFAPPPLCAVQLPAECWSLNPNLFRRSLLQINTLEHMTSPNQTFHTKKHIPMCQ